MAMLRRAVLLFALPLVFCRSQDMARIFNGTRASLGLMPWQAALSIFRDTSTLPQICGGTLLSSRWVLTAAQCLYTASRCTVRLGSLDYGSGGQAFELPDSSFFYLHSGFDGSGNNHDNDIALAKLPSAVVLNGNVKVINILPATSSITATTPLRISGWGNTLASPAATNRGGAMYIHERDTQPLHEVPDAQWREKCLRRQQRVLERQGEYEEITITELSDNKLGCALFGIHWTEAELPKIHEVKNKIIRTFESTYHIPCVRFHLTVLCIPVLDCDNTGDEVSLLRISIGTERCFFVDHYARVYHSWCDFLLHNMLPDCMICAPALGAYRATHGHVQLQYGKSYTKTRYVTEFYTNLVVLLAILSASLLYLGELMNINTTLAYYIAIVGIVSAVCMIFNCVATTMDRIRHAQALWDPMDLLNILFAGVIITSNVMMYEEFRRSKDPSILSKILEYTPEYVETLSYNAVQKCEQIFPALKKLADFCGFGHQYRLIENFLTWESSNETQGALP